ncbi:MAG: GNAT family N-acetyltransferase [Gammaproteobacteria bacterium]|nr:GNAT family N-acetyltransferase [Gammaproteobacteria bacterium]
MKVDPSEVFIREAANDDTPDVRELFIEYQQWLNVDLCFQNFEQELTSLPGRYGPPRGVIYLAVNGAVPVGCVAVRPHLENQAELKRLYVRSENRGQGIGERLFDQAMSSARRMGYASIVLDTLPEMRAAKRLYLGYGFQETEPYYHNPEQGAEFYRYFFT